MSKQSQQHQQPSGHPAERPGDHLLDNASGRPASQHRKGTRTSPPAMPMLPLTLLLEEYARDLRRRNIAPTTIRGYQQVLQLAIAFWQQHFSRPPSLDDLTARSAEAFLDHLLERGKIHWRHPEGSTGQPLARASLRTYVRTLKVFASWLADPRQAYTPENRLTRLAMPRPDRTHKQPLNTEEIAALVGACDVLTLMGTRDQAAISSVLSGCLWVRRSEEHTSELQSHFNLVYPLLLEQKQ